MGRAEWWWAGAGLVVLGACGSGPTVTPPPVPLASASHFSLTCSRHSVSAFDSSRQVLSGRTLDCWATVGDATGAPIEGATVRFSVEAGQSVGEAITDAQGRASLGYQTGLPLPFDVEPERWTAAPLQGLEYTGIPVAPAWMEPETWVENPALLVLAPPEQRVPTFREPRRPDPIRVGPSGRLTNNPRDNLVTLVATVAGAEAFTDLDGDGAYDPGERFVDQVEPFVDGNDNGTWDSFEAFVDLNRNREWDGMNERFDPETTLWVQERVLWTGAPSAEDLQPIVPGVVGHRPTVLAMGTRLTCQPDADGGCREATAADGGPGTYLAYVADPWFNAPAATLTCDASPVSFPPLVDVTSLEARLDGGTVPAGVFVYGRVSDARAGSGAPFHRWSAVGLPFSWNVACRGAAEGSWAQVTINLPLSGTVE